MQGKFIDLTGTKFGHLRVVSHSIKRDSRGWRTLWDVRCDCGVTKTIDGRTMRRGDVKSCGCKKNETFRLRPYLASIEGEELGELRKQLYALGFSKRAIATACKNVTHKDV